MSETIQALKVALAAARQLPLKLQRQLAEQLISDENSVVVSFQRLSAQKQERLAQLLDKNSEGCLKQSEQSELRRLGVELDKMLLANSEAMARAMRPELFDKKGRPVKGRFKQALGKSSARTKSGRRKAQR